MKEITNHKEKDYYVGKYSHSRLDYLKNTAPLKWIELMNNYEHSSE